MPIPGPALQDSISAMNVMEVSTKLAHVRRKHQARTPLTPQDLQTLGQCRPPPHHRSAPRICSHPPTRPPPPSCTAPGTASCIGRVGACALNSLLPPSPPRPPPPLSPSLPPSLPPSLEYSISASLPPSLPRSILPIQFLSILFNSPCLSRRSASRCSRASGRPPPAASASPPPRWYGLAPPFGVLRAREESRKRPCVRPLRGPRRRLRHARCSAALMPRRQAGQLIASLAQAADAVSDARKVRVLARATAGGAARRARQPFVYCDTAFYYGDITATRPTGCGDAAILRAAYGRPGRGRAARGSPHRPLRGAVATRCIPTSSHPCWAAHRRRAARLAAVETQRAAEGGYLRLHGPEGALLPGPRALSGPSAS